MKSTQDEFLDKFINDNINKNKDYFWKRGYNCLGPLLYSYSKWLEENFLKEKYDNIFFLSRDGFIMQKAFEIVNQKLKTKYLYASRRALIVPTLWIKNDLEDVFSVMFFQKYITIGAFIKKLGLIPEDYEKIVQKYGYKLEQNINIYIEKESDNFKYFYKELQPEISKNSKKEYENLINYLNKNKFENKVAIVDIGWFGNMQNALQKIVDISNINAKIDGYYVGIVPYSEKQEYLKMNGFLFQKNKNEEMYLKKKFFNSIFEIAFMANHGSVKRYLKNEVEFYDFEYKGTDTFDKIEEFQKGALQFVKDYNNKGKVKIDEYTCMKDFFEFGNNPTNEDIEKFKEIYFYDDEIYNIIPNDLSVKYLLNPRKFINEFKKSIWKTAFLKKIFKININYYIILVSLRKILIKDDKNDE